MWTNGFLVLLIYYLFLLVLLNILNGCICILFYNYFYNDYVRIQSTYTRASIFGRNVRFTQQLVLFAPQAVSVHSHVQTLLATLSSRQVWILLGIIILKLYIFRFFLLSPFIYLFIYAANFKASCCFHFTASCWKGSGIPFFFFLVVTQPHLSVSYF